MRGRSCPHFSRGHIVRRPCVERTRLINLTHDESLGDTGYGIVVLSTFEGTIAPDGTRFFVGFAEVNGLTLNELSSRFAGTWKIEDTFATPVMQFHQFSLTAAELVNFPSSPTLLSPPSGAILPPKFQVAFPAENSVLIQGAPFNIDARTDTSLSIAVPFESGVSEKTLLLTPRASVINRFSATPITSNPANTFSIRLSHETLAAAYPVTVQIPEPSTIALSGISLLSLAALRRRK